MKLFFVDLETTGVKHWRNGIHQISGAIEIDGEVKEEFDFKVCPHPQCTIEDEALAVSGLTKEIVLSYEPMANVYRKIIKMLGKYVDKFNKQDKFFLVGYNNASFDNQFFRAFFVQNNDNYFGSWFWSNSLDVMVLATEYLKHKRTELADFKLKTVAAFVGLAIEEDKLHDAIYDIHLTRKIYHIVTNKPVLLAYETESETNVVQ
jgi:DNA polymerase III subunit epsilon